MPWKTITRQELYDEVWSQAVCKLAPKYNLSDVGFAKLCKRFDIPRPPRGYWAKLEAGKKVNKTPLPQHDEGPEIRVYRPGPEEIQSNEEAKTEVEKMTEGLSLVEVAASLRGSHKLVSATRQAYEGTKKRSDGILETPEDATINLSVGREQLRRSLLIIDALLKAFESLGHKISAGPGVEAFGQTVTFCIRESIKTIEEEYEPTQESMNGRYEFFHERKRKHQIPGGKLTLLIPDAELHWAYGCRKQWKDAKVQRLENCLNSIVEGVLEVAAKKRDHEIEMEQRRLAEIEAAKQRKIDAQRRAELRKEQKVEQQKLDQLLEQVSSWRKSHEIRSFLDHVRRVHDSNGSEIVPDSDLGQWLAWAAQQADRFDPTINSPKSILDEVIPEESGYPSHRHW